MQRKWMLGMALLCAVPTLAEEVIEIDTLRIIDLEELVVVSSPKETVKLRQQPLAVSLISPADLSGKHLTSLKGVSSFVPNFIMPDYGSRLTSSIYIRGIGSRINSPAIGMYVDNVPYLDKSAFDISLFDVDRIDVLRGPQGTLYGRNTMGGLIKVHTRNPFNYQGTDLKLSAATRNGQWGASLMHYARVNDKFAFSLGGYYQGADGFFRNCTLQKKADGMKGGGARGRFIYIPTQLLKFDLTLGYDNSDEGGYAYGEYNTTTRETGAVLSNQEGRYRRSMFNSGLNIELNMPTLVFNSVTGYQNLTDRMFMDQDFSQDDIFILTQRQRLNTLTQEFTLKNKAGSVWQWTTGLFGSYQSLHTSSPVGFGADGMGMLTNAINSYFPNKMLEAMGMSMGLKFTDASLLIPSEFDTPVWSGALFHQSSLTAGNWVITLGVRVEHERMKINYNTSCATPYEFVLNYTPMHATIPVNETAETSFVGSLKNNYTQFLPKVALQYNLNKQTNFYASVSKGYRSGGYNLQMFSDIAQGGLKNSMYTQILNGVTAGLNKYVQYGMPQAVVNRIVGYMSPYMQPTTIDIASSIVYKPEQSWNYELGSHFSLLDSRLCGDFSVFYMRIKDQQITRFVDSGLGRILVNAGKSESYGFETSLQGQITDQFTMNGSFGYTHATFLDYNTAFEGTEGEDYHGNYVPYVPRYTFALGADYRIPTRGFVKNVMIGANLTGTGKTYWTEANDVNQGTYALLGAYVMADMGCVTLDVWGKNLTNNDYNTFCFSNGATGQTKYFAQLGKPIQLGVDLKLHF